jgi:hypothetical protein
MRKLSLPSGPFQRVALQPVVVTSRSLRAHAACTCGAGAEGPWLTLTSSPELRTEGRSAATTFLPKFRSRAFAAFAGGRLPAQWNEVNRRAFATSLRQYSTLTGFSGREWMALIKITDCWAGGTYGLA